MKLMTPQIVAGLIKIEAGMITARFRCPNVLLCICKYSTGAQWVLQTMANDAFYKGYRLLHRWHCIWWSCYSQL